jgi:hypothetical protein
MNSTQTGQGKRTLWERILVLLEEDLSKRRDMRVMVEVTSKDGSCLKEVGELSSLEIGNLDPGQRERATELLLDRYLAEQGRIDLLKRRRAYTKNIRDLTPADLPALIEAERLEIEESRDDYERKDFIMEVQHDLDHLQIVESTAELMQGGSDDKMHRDCPINRSN